MIKITIEAHEVAELFRDKLKEKYNLEIPDNPIHDGGWLCDSLTAITYNKESFYGQKHTRIDAISFEIEVEENERKYSRKICELCTTCRQGY